MTTPRDKPSVERGFASDTVQLVAPTVAVIVGQKLGQSGKQKPTKQK